MLTTPDLVFLVLAAVTVGGAIVALEAREVVYGALALGVSLIGVAGFFVLLSAPFPAMFQIVVYVGAVVVLILFTIMLVHRERWMKIKERVAATGVAGAVLIALGVALTGLASGLGALLPAEGAEAAYEEVGGYLVTAYWPALLVLALVLTAAVIGALVLAKVERREG